MSISEITKPEQTSGTALVRIERFGLCGSDLNTYRGGNPLVTYPRVPGHELCGVVENIESGGAVKIGDTVTINPYSQCGTCSACRAGRVNCCRHNQTLGVQRDGGATEYLVVPMEKLIQVDGLTEEEVACIEPLSVGSHAIERSRVRKGQTVLVFGCGMIGLGVIAAAVYRAANVIAVDIDDAKLERARSLGAKFTINSAVQDLEKVVADITQGEGAEIVVEAVGRPETYVAAVRLVAFAGRVVYVGYSDKAVTYETKIILTKEIDIVGSRNAMPEDFDRVIAMLRARSIDVGTLVTQRFEFEQTGAAFEYWSEHPGEVTKIHVIV